MSEDTTPVPSNPDEQPVTENVTSGEAVEKMPPSPEAALGDQPEAQPTEPVQQPAQPAQPVQPAQPQPEAQPVQPQPTYQQAGQTPPPPPAGYAQPGTQQMPPQQTYVPPQTPSAPGSGKALASLICGICAILFSWLPLVGIILGIVALVLASQYVKAFGKESRATAGKVTGIVGIVFSVLMSIFIAISLLFFGLVIDEYNNNRGSNRSSSSISSTSPSTSSASESAAYDVADDVVDKMCTFSDAEYEAFAKYLEEEYLDIASTGADGTSYEALGLDKVAFTEQWLRPLSYTISDVSVYGDSATVKVEFEQTDELSFWTKLSEKAVELMDDPDFDAMNTDEAYKKVGVMMQEALDETGTDETSWNLSLTKSGDTWTVDKSSYEGMVHVVFGYDYDKAAPEGVK